METFVLRGGKRLHGELSVCGSKNHALKLIPSCILSRQPVTITNLPGVEDVVRMLEIVDEFGATVKKNSQHTVTITPPKTFPGLLDRTRVPQLRASIVLLGPLLARFGHVVLPEPGGDNIGKRPINFFVHGFRAMGAQVTEKKHEFVFRAPHGLHGAHIDFPNVSVTATETLMMAAVLAKGTTVLHNAALEPEIARLAEQLNARGAKIIGAGTPIVSIRGTRILRGGKVEAMPDRIEAGSLVILAAATKSRVVIRDCEPDTLDIPLAVLSAIGVPLTIGRRSIEVRPPKRLRPFSLVTHEYPGFPTDLQAPMTVLFTQAYGISLVRETIYDGRLFYTDLLNKLGARINLLDPYRALVHGPTPLHGALVESPDIRAGIAMVIAGLVAAGTTTIQNIYQIDRGYERLEQRLATIGADIRRVAQ